MIRDLGLTDEGPGSGRRRDRHDLRLLSLQGRPRGDRGRPSAGAGAGDELRQCGRRMPELRRPMGRARHAAQGHALAVRAPCAVDAASAHRPRSMAMACRLSCATAPRSALRTTRRACSASPITARRAWSRCAKRPASPTITAPAACCRFFAPTRSLKAGRRAAARAGVVRRSASAGRCARSETDRTCARGRVPLCGRPASAGRRNRRLSPVHPQAGRTCCANAALLSSSTPRWSGLS